MSKKWSDLFIYYSFIFNSPQLLLVNLPSEKYLIVQYCIKEIKLNLISSDTNCKFFHNFCSNCTVTPERQNYFAETTGKLTKGVLLLEESAPANTFVIAMARVFFIWAYLFYLGVSVLSGRANDEKRVRCNIWDKLG